jgi:uncharacterized protein (TIGR02145 family)
MQISNSASSDLGSSAKKILLFGAFIVSSFSIFAQVGIGIATPHTSAKLQVESTNKGFLPPRMNQSQRNGILNPEAGLMVYCTDCGVNGELQVYNGSLWTNSAGGTAAATFVCGTITSTVTFTYKGSSVTYKTVVGANSRCWLDRNLGAAQVAATSTDHLSYGDLFQWGRGDDGHQSVTWTNSTTGTGTSTTTTLSGSDQPLHGYFIMGSTDWRNPRNDNLWQGASGINNPCPIGFRLPTEAEWTTEQTSWSTLNSAGAFASPLKLPVAGYRHFTTPASLLETGNRGYYWSSTVSTTISRLLWFTSTSVAVSDFNRSYGGSVRCIKN